MKLHLELPEHDSDIIIERGAINKASQLMNLNRRVLVVTDSGVPEEYSKKIAAQCKSATIVTFEQGEQSKNLKTFEMLCQAMLDNGFTRSDCCVAVGGGVVTDITGFASACYMRGIEFYNIPTTLLAQTDASVGGKTAVDFNGVKNIIGAFHQPTKVIIDPDTLSTLDKRQFCSGMAEVIKMSVIFDKDMFETIESGDIDEILDTVIARSVELKADVVLKDEKESGLRKVLNFGHTVGHAVETLSGQLHGECVAVGMCCMCSEEVRARLVPVLQKFNLPVSTDISPEKLCEVLSHDKKMSGDNISVIWSEHIGEFEIKTLPAKEFMNSLKEI